MILDKNIVMATDLSTQITGLSQLGTDLGGFFSGIAPGLVSLVIVLGIGAAIIMIILAVAKLVGNKIKM